MPNAFNRDELIDILVERFQIPREDIKRARLFYLKGLYVLMCMALERGVTPDPKWLEGEFDRLIHQDILTMLQGQDLELIGTVLHGYSDAKE